MLYDDFAELDATVAAVDVWRALALCGYTTYFGITDSINAVNQDVIGILPPL